MPYAFHSEPVAADPAQDLPLGDWHLLRSDDDEVDLPPYRIDLRFKRVGEALSAVLLSGSPEVEEPFASASFNGVTMHLCIEPASPSGLDSVTIELTRAGDKFVGQFVVPGGKRLDFDLKLVRVRNHSN